MYRNNFDKDGSCSRMGESAESSFVTLLAKKGKVYEATASEQMQHFDFVLETPEGKEWKYEVKARKRIARGDSEVNDDTVYLEFLNVRGNLGWLYGKADFLVFERASDFVIVDRLKLVTMAESKCQVSHKVSSPSQCLYKGYTRYGRNDLVSRVLMTDIEAIAHEVWTKQAEK